MIMGDGWIYLMHPLKQAEGHKIKAAFQRFKNGCCLIKWQSRYAGFLIRRSVWVNSKSTILLYSGLNFEEFFTKNGPFLLLLPLY